MPASRLQNSFPFILLRITPLQYFYGLNNSIVHGNVRAILDSVIVALSLNPSRKFTYVEPSLFCIEKN